MAGNSNTMVAANGATLTSRLAGSESAEGAVKGNLRYIRAGELKKSGVTGLVVEGIYEGTIANEMSGKNDYKIREANGDLAIINNTASLSNQMADLELGSYVAIKYAGTTVIKNGPRKGKEAHQFNVFSE